MERNVPQQVGLDIDWTDIAVGGTHACGVQSVSGFLSCWGEGLYGKLGYGGATSLDTPSAVSGTDWAKVRLGVNHSCALKTDGTLYC